MGRGRGARGEVVVGGARLRVWVDLGDGRSRDGRYVLLFRSGNGGDRGGVVGDLLGGRGVLRLLQLLLFRFRLDEKMASGNRRWMGCGSGDDGGVVHLHRRGPSVGVVAHYRRMPRSMANCLVRTHHYHKCEQEEPKGPKGLRKRVVVVVRIFGWGRHEGRSWSARSPRRELEFGFLMP